MPVPIALDYGPGDRENFEKIVVVDAGEKSFRTKKLGPAADIDLYDDFYGDKRCFCRDADPEGKFTTLMDQLDGVRGERHVFCRATGKPDAIGWFRGRRHRKLLACAITKSPPPSTRLAGCRAYLRKIAVFNLVCQRGERPGRMPCL